MFDLIHYYDPTLGPLEKPCVADLREQTVVRVCPSNEPYVLELDNGDRLAGSVKIAREQFMSDDGTMKAVGIQTKMRPITEYNLQEGSMKSGSVQRPPNPPANAAKLPHIKPTAVRRDLGKPRPNDFKKEEAAHTMEALFREAIGFKTYNLIPKVRGTTDSWKTWTHRMYYGYKDAAGPLERFEPHAVAFESLRDLLHGNAEYFDNLYMMKVRLYGVKGAKERATQLEILAHDYVTWRNEAIQAYEDKKAQEKRKKAEKKKQIKHAQKRLGLVSPGRGVSAPSFAGVLSEHDKVGLQGLGQQPESPRKYCSILCMFAYDVQHLMLNLLHSVYPTEPSPRHIPQGLLELSWLRFLLQFRPRQRR